MSEIQAKIEILSQVEALILKRLTDNEDVFDDWDSGWIAGNQGALLEVQRLKNELFTRVTDVI